MNRLAALEAANGGILTRLSALEHVTPPPDPNPTPTPAPTPTPTPTDGQVRTVTDNIADALLAVSAPTDIVVVPYRPASDPWRERIPLWHRGKDAATPFRAKFLRGPNGERSVVDARGAKLDPRYSFLGATVSRMGLCTVHTRPGMPDPAFIDVEGIHLTGASTEFPDNGQWDDYACGIWSGRNDGVTFRDFEVSWCANGVFGHGMYLPTDSTFDGAVTHDNGSTKTGQVHNIYFEGRRVKWTNANLGRMRPGALGGNFKDRSSNLVIDTMRIDGGKRMLDLSDYQDSAEVNGNISGGANVGISHITFINRPGDAVDLIYTEGRRSPEGVGPFVTANNITVVMLRDQSEVHHVILFRSEYSDAAILRMGKVLVAKLPKTAGAWTPVLLGLGEQGRIELTDTCAANQPVYPIFPIEDRSRVTGWDDHWKFAGPEKAGGDPDMGFVDLANGDYRVKAGSEWVGLGA